MYHCGVSVFCAPAAELLRGSLNRNTIVPAPGHYCAHNGLLLETRSVFCERRAQACSREYVRTGSCVFQTSNSRNTEAMCSYSWTFQRVSRIYSNTIPDQLPAPQTVLRICSWWWVFDPIILNNFPLENRSEPILLTQLLYYCPTTRTLGTSGVSLYLKPNRGLTNRQSYSRLLKLYLQY